MSHYPRRYARRGELTALTQLPLDENVTIVAEVLEVRTRSMQARKGSILEVTISDGKGILTLTFFNQAWRANELRPGVRGIFAGKVGDYRGTLQLAHPDYELFDERDPLTRRKRSAWAELPIPIYPGDATSRAGRCRRRSRSCSTRCRRSTTRCQRACAPLDGSCPYSRALELIHRPTVDADWGGARKPCAFTRRSCLQAALLQQRQKLRETAATARACRRASRRIRRRLPFTLTGDQSDGRRTRSRATSRLPCR